MAAMLPCIALPCPGQPAQPEDLSTAELAPMMTLAIPQIILFGIHNPTYLTSSPLLPLGHQDIT